MSITKHKPNKKYSSTKKQISSKKQMSTKKQISTKYTINTKKLDNILKEAKKITLDDITFNNILSEQNTILHDIKSILHLDNEQIYENLPIEDSMTKPNNKFNLMIDKYNKALSSTLNTTTPLLKETKIKQTRKRQPQKLSIKHETKYNGNNKRKYEFKISKPNIYITH